MQLLWRISRRTLQKLKVELPYDSTIHTTRYIAEEIKTLIEIDTGTTMFTEALFKIAKIGKQPECLSKMNG